MYVSTAPHAARAPRVQRVALLLFALAAAMVFWAILSFSVAGNDSQLRVPQPVDPASVRAVAFLEHGSGSSSLVLRDPADGTRARTVATFERINGGPVTGRVAPDARHAAIVHPAPHASAYLSIVDLATGTALQSPAFVDPAALPVWSADSARVIAVSAQAPDATGRRAASLVEVDAATGQTLTIASFPSVLHVAPIGFATVGSAGQALLVVVVDQAGSALWRVAGMRAEPVATLSQGRTRDWALSQDGSQLAYVEVRSGADVPALGHVVSTVTGAPVATLDQDAAFDGAAWKSGSAVAGFGGPGGNLALIPPGAGYLVPAAWSPDGATLVARVVVPGPGGGTSTESWQSLDETSEAPHGSRTVLFEHADAAAFVGWAQTSLLEPSRASGAAAWP